MAVWTDLVLCANNSLLPTDITEVFILPEVLTKTSTERVVVLNTVADRAVVGKVSAKAKELAGSVG